MAGSIVPFVVIKTLLAVGTHRDSWQALLCYPVPQFLSL